MLLQTSLHLGLGLFCYVVSNFSSSSHPLLSIRHPSIWHNSGPTHIFVFIVFLIFYRILSLCGLLLHLSLIDVIVSKLLFFLSNCLVPVQSLLQNSGWFWYNEHLTMSAINETPSYVS